MPGALNKFQTVRFKPTTTLTSVYSPPIGYTGVVLLAQFSNKTDHEVKISAGVLRNGEYISLATLSSVPGNDSGNALTGRLILQYGDYFQASASEALAVDLTLSYLETRVIGS